MKIFFGIALAAGLAAAPVPALAQAAGTAPHAGEHARAPRAAPLQRLLEQRAELGLSDAQVSRLQTIQARLREQNAPLLEQLRAARPAGAAARQQLTPEQRQQRREQMRQMTPEQRQQQREQMRQHREQMAPVAKQLRDNHRAALEQVREVLRDEQEAKLRDARGERGRHGRGEGRDHRRPGQRERA